MFGSLVAIMLTGLPIAFGFMFTCIMGATIFWGGWDGIDQLAMSFYSAVAFGGSIGMGLSISRAVEGIARNPEASGKIMTTMIIGLALIESLAIYTLVIIFIKA